MNSRCVASGIRFMEIRCAYIPVLRFYNQFKIHKLSEKPDDQALYPAFAGREAVIAIASKSRLPPHPALQRKRVSPKSRISRARILNASHSKRKRKKNSTTISQAAVTVIVPASRSTEHPCFVIHSATQGCVKLNTHVRSGSVLGCVLTQYTPPSRGR